MKITKISMYHYDWIASVDETLKFAKSEVEAIAGRVMHIETDAGIDGWSEITPYGNSYLEMFPDAIAPGANLLAPSFIGKDPRNIEENYYMMDRLLMGHPYIKSPFDNACWDILAKPVYELIGGKQTEEAKIIAFLHVNDRIIVDHSDNEKVYHVAETLYNGGNDISKERGHGNRGGDLQ